MNAGDAASGPTVAAEVEMSKEMKKKEFGRALEIFSAAETKNVQAACLPALCTVLGQCARCRDQSAHCLANR